MDLLGTERRRAFGVIIALTFVAAAIRVTGLGRLGLVQFDEGIYAFAGLWSVLPGGFARLDPMVIPYAPPGFPFLVGVSYSLFGVSDLSAIVVSIIAGTLAIPVVGWLGWRTFGPPAGVAAAAFAALSGVHVAFSRMALTDASFLLVWLVAVGIGQRFVERPRLSRALALGLAVGLAQNFKYNGWLTGVAITLAVLLDMSLVPLERRVSRIARMVGLGTAAAFTSALVYGPWFRFVEANGGYAGLLAHQKGYMGGLSSWFPHWTMQMAQGVALSGGSTWGAFAVLLALAGVWFTTKIGRSSGLVKPGMAGVPAMALLAFVPMVSWWVSLAWILGPWASRSPAARVLGGWWVLLSVITPFYHPYARLWLPLHAASCVITAGVVASLAPMISRSGDPTAAQTWIPRRVPAVVGVIAAIAIGHLILERPRPRPISGLLGPSDSLRTACHEMAGVLPADIPGIRLLARPPIRFYLALLGRGPIRTESDLPSLLRSVDRESWVVVDETLLRQEREPSIARRRLHEVYEPVEAWPTELNLPTLLDVDPAAAHGESRARSASLLLFRPRRPRVSP